MWQPGSKITKMPWSEFQKHEERIINNAMGIDPQEANSVETNQTPNQQQNNVGGMEQVSSEELARLRQQAASNQGMRYDYDASKYTVNYSDNVSNVRQDEAQTVNNNAEQPQVTQSQSAPAEQQSSKSDKFDFSELFNPAKPNGDSGIDSSQQTTAQQNIQNYQNNNQPQSTPQNQQQFNMPDNVKREIDLQNQVRTDVVKIAQERGHDPRQIFEVFNMKASELVDLYEVLRDVKASMNNQMAINPPPQSNQGMYAQHNQQQQVQGFGQYDQQMPQFSNSNQLAADGWQGPTTQQMQQFQQRQGPSVTNLPQPSEVTVDSNSVIELPSEVRF